jgi:hypothetical protein
VNKHSTHRGGSCFGQNLQKGVLLTNIFSVGLYRQPGNAHARALFHDLISAEPAKAGTNKIPDALFELKINEE